MGVKLDCSSERLMNGKENDSLAVAKEPLITTDMLMTSVYDEATQPLKDFFGSLKNKTVEIHHSNPNPSLKTPASKISKRTSFDSLQGRSYVLLVEKIQKREAFFNINTFYELNEEPLSTSTTIGKAKENLTKNRYPDVLPNDSTLVSTSNNGYFNGNLVKFLDDDSNVPTYIATQAPLMSTINDFWDVIFNSNTDTIVMLTNFIEQRRKKADVYWPDESQPLEQFSDVTVKFLGLTDYEQAKFTIREFEITKGDVSRIIKHFHFMSWPDHGVVDVEKFNALLREVENLHQTGPLVVHCSAGIGRTGTFIATHKARDLIKKGATEINIFDMVNALREERAKSVQTKEQYQLIFNSISEFLVSEQI